MSTDFEFQVPKQSKKNAKKNLPRVYIGNLPLEVTKTDLESVLPISNPSLEVISNAKNSHAFVTCRSNKEIDDIITQLHQKQFQGRKLTVQREKKTKPKGNGNGKPGGSSTNTSNFGGWSKPKATVPSPEEKLEEDPAVEEAHTMAGIIAEEFQSATTKDDAINATLASLAAVSFLAPALNEENKEVTPETHEGETKEPEVEDFMARCQKPLSELLEDYGEEDPNWQAIQPTLPTEPVDDTKTTEPETQPTENRLGRHGKAPIHVEFISFGYLHGAPGAIRNGWSHAQPLSTLECRDLPMVPGHLSWRDGTSGFVQKSLPEAREMAKSIASQALDAIVLAIDEGRHGYAAPLQVKIYVGSETGRHRSVVVCETAAKQLRKLLRSNENNRVTAPVSVGTAHRDLERNKNRPQKGGVRKEDLEG